MPKSENRGISDDLAAKFRVDWKKTTWNRDMEAFPFKFTYELRRLDHFIGQDRAQEAIRFGLEVDKPGYNLFVTNVTGTGKTSATQAQLQSIVDDLFAPKLELNFSNYVEQCFKYFSKDVKNSTPEGAVFFQY